jgi:phosphomannomutase
MAAVEGKPLTVLLAELYRRVGEFHTRRENIHLTPELEDAYAGKLAAPPTDLAGKKIEQVVTIDGAKFIFRDGTWVLFRKSGTEPVVRVYAEARNADELDRMFKAADAFIRG